MKSATQILSEEHQQILKVISALQNECSAIENGRKIDEAFLKKSIAFIRNYADKFHHAKEEDILFKDLCSDSVNMHCNPTQQMMHEHDLGRAFVKEFEQGLKSMNKNKIIENAQGYCSLLQEHIFKEDSILYPMADEVLNAAMQKSLLERFKKAESKFSKSDMKNYLAFAKDAEKRK